MRYPLPATFYRSIRRSIIINFYSNSLYCKSSLKILAEYIINHHKGGLIERVCHRSSNIASVYPHLILPSQRNQRTPLKEFIFYLDNLLEDLSQSKLSE